MTNRVVVSPTSQFVEISGGNSVLTIASPAVSLVTAAVQGPQGPMGPRGPSGTDAAAGTIHVAGASASLGQVTFSNSNNIVFGLNGQTLTASAAFPAQSTQPAIQSISAGTTRVTTGEVVFSNSNGLSFGLNGNTLTGSYTVPAQTVQPGIQSISAGTTRATTGEVVLSNSNNVSFGLNGGTLTASASFPAQSVQPGIQSVSAGATRITTGELVFSNANGLSFGANGNTITGSYTVPTQSAQTVGVYASSNTTGQSSSSTIDARSLSIRGAGIVSVGVSGGQLVVSATAAGAADGFNIIAAGTQTANTTGTVAFLNSNGLTFGMSNSSQITASYTVPSTTGLISAINYSAGTTSTNATDVVFSNSNGLSFGLNGRTITASHNALTSQSNQAFSASGGSSTFQTLNFANANGATFLNNAGSIQLSYTVPTQSVQTIGVYASNNTTGQGSSSTLDARSLTFRGAGIVSVGNSAGEVIISAIAAGGGDGVNILSAGTQQAGSNATVQLADSNGISFGMSGSSQITASYTVPSTAGLISAVNFSAGTTSTNATGVVFSNSNGLSFGLNGRTVTASYTAPTVTNSSLTLSDGVTSISLARLAFTASNGLTLSLSTTTGGSATLVGSYTVPSTAGLISAVNFSAGTTSTNATDIMFSNSNGLSFGLNGRTVTASHNALTSQSNQAFSASGGSSAFQTLNFANSNGLTFSNSNGSVVASYTVPNTAGLLSAVNVSAGTTSNNLSAFVASNSNNVSFGLNGSTLTASASFNQTAESNTFGISNLGNTAGTSGVVSSNQARVLFAGGNNITLSQSVNGASATITISGPNTVAQSVQPGIQSISAGTTRITTGEIVLSNSNGISFGVNGNTVTASYTVPSQSVQSLGLYASSNTTGQSSSSTIDARSLSFRGAGNISVGMSGGEIIVSGSGGGAADGGVGISAGGSSLSSGTVVLSNSNNVTFGLNGSTITASASFSQSTAPAGVAAGTQTATSGTVVFSNSNGVEFGMSGDTRVTARNVQTVYLDWSTAANSLTVSNNRLFFNVLGNATGDQAAGYAMRLSVGGFNAVHAGGSSITASRLSLQNGNGVSFGVSTEFNFPDPLSYISGSHDGIRSISAGTTQGGSSRIVFSNSNGVSFGLNAGTITASHNGLTSQTAQTIGLYASSNTTGQSTSSTVDARSLSFRGAGIASVGMSGGQVIVSVPAGGGGGDGFNILAAGTQTAVTNVTVNFANSNGISFGMSDSSQITAIYTVPSTAGLISAVNFSAGTTSGNASAVVFSNGNNVSFGYDAGTITASVEAGGGAVTLSYFNPQDAYPLVVGQQGNGTLHFQPMQAPNVQFDRAAFLINYTQASNSTLTASITMALGFYTRNDSTLSLASSTSTLFTVNGTGTASSSVYVGQRILTIPYTNTLTEGQYYVGILSRTSTAGANASISQLLCSQLNTNFSGIMGAASAGTVQQTRGLGVYTASTSVLPSSVAFSQINGSNSNVLRKPAFYLVSGTF